MKNLKKLASLVLALVMVFSLATTAFAAPAITKTEGVTGEGSIKVNLLDYPDDYVTTNTYTIYKVFDADFAADGTTIVYKLADGDTAVPEASGFVANDQGYVYFGTKGENGVITPSNAAITDAQIAAIADFVTDEDIVATVVTTQDDTSFTVDGLPYGYYYINTTTGSLVILNTAAEDAEVTDKNKVPQVDKKITEADDYVDDAGKNAIAQIGSNVEYTGEVTIAKGAENYIYHDTMEDGLSFNNDVTIEGMTKGTDYTVNYPSTVDGETFEVVFMNDSTKNLADGTVIKIVYTAKITNEALTVDPENNTAYLSYGRNPGENKTPTVTTNVYSAKFTVVKHDGDGQPLANAGFVLMNSEDKFYKYTPAQAAEGVEGEDGYKPAVEAKTEWVTLTDTTAAGITAAIAAGTITEYKSDADGNVESFKGLRTDDYTLIESTVPTGYNQAANYEFTVEDGDYSTDNLEQETIVINNEGAVLPTTGGMGTTLFYVFGGIMVLAAVVLLVTKKRMSVAE